MTENEPICTCGHLIGHHAVTDAYSDQCEGCPCDLFTEDSTEPLF